MSEFYRKMAKDIGSTPVSVRLANDTLEGIQEIKRLFQLRFPTAKFPTLSACLDLALRRYLEEFGNDQAALKAEIADFKARYEKKELSA